MDNEPRLELGEENLEELHEKWAEFLASNPGLSKLRYFAQLAESLRNRYNRDVV